MSDLKIDSQSTRTVQTQPGPQPSSPITAGASDSIEPTPEAAPKQKRRTATKIDSAKPDVTPATKPEKSSTGAKSKRQATSKTPNQSASTRVKLTWEPTPSIETVLVELNAFNERLNATKVALDELRATVEATVDKPLQDEARSTVQLPLERTPKAQAVDRNALLRAIESDTATQPTDRAPSPAPAPQKTIQPVDRISPPPQPIPTFRPTTRFPTPQQRRRKSLNRLQHFVLHLPKKPLAIAIDAALWVLASAGLRIGLNALVIGLPLLSGPIKALLIVPALIAIYSAFFVPQANQVGIYRLLLISLGLFIGGKL